VVVLRVVYRLGADGLAEVGIVGQAEDGDPLQALLLERLKQLGAHQDQALDERLARVARLGGVEGPVQVVQDVDELQEQALAPLVVTPLDVPREAVFVGLGLSLELAVGPQHLGEEVLGEARPLVEGLRRTGIGGLQGVGESRRFGETPSAVSHLP
jgi:hypothetical protein